jgi:hypothetical protein
MEIAFRPTKRLLLLLRLNRTIVEWKQVGKQIAHRPQFPSAGFNRTIMEWKYSHYVLQHQTAISLNRTIVEWKYLFEKMRVRYNIVSIEP